MAAIVLVNGWVIDPARRTEITRVDDDGRAWSLPVWGGIAGYNADNPPAQTVVLGFVLTGGGSYQLRAWATVAGYNAGNTPSFPATIHQILHGRDPNDPAARGPDVLSRLIALFRRGGN